MKQRQRRIHAALGIVVALAVSALVIWHLTPREPATSGGPLTFRRLSEPQYMRSIQHIFGSDIEVPGRFDPPRREDGLLAVGDSRVVISSSAFEQAELRAREIAAQVLSEDRRGQILPCTPRSAQVFDLQCATQFIEKYGRLLYRRPLNDQELTATMGIVSAAAELSADFYSGLEAGLARLLVSPNFLFRVERAVPDGEGGDLLRLDDYSLAARISFLLWDAPPDEALLDAAQSGALRKNSGLNAQVKRMIESPRFEQGVRAFFFDMFSYEQFRGLTKEAAIFPIFTPQLAHDAMEQALRTIVDLLIINEGDYRDLFTTRKTFLNRTLSALYNVPAPEEALNGWAPYSFSPEDKRQGILTHAAFLLLDPTHEGRSSPTIRGKAVRELFLCQVVPPPPPSVEFFLLEDSGNPQHKTTRERLTVHSTVPTCAGCHAITDPIGLALENYSAVGEYRTTENGALIDASGTFEGKAYQDAIEMQQLLRESPALTNCLAQRVYEYGVGRPVTAGERDWMRYVREQFAKDRYVIASLMSTIATSKAFRSISPGVAAETAIASN